MDARWRSCSASRAEARDTPRPPHEKKQDSPSVGETPITLRMRDPAPLGQVGSGDRVFHGNRRAVVRERRRSGSSGASERFRRLAFSNQGGVTRTFYESTRRTYARVRPYFGRASRSATLWKSPSELRASVRCSSDDRDPNEPKRATPFVAREAAGLLAGTGLRIVRSTARSFGLRTARARGSRGPRGRSPSPLMRLRERGTRIAK